MRLSVDFKKRYQVTIDPHKLVYYGVPLMDVTRAVAANNNDVGGSLYEMNATGYLIRGLGYITSLDDIKEIPIGTYKSIPIRLSDISEVQMSPDLRLGIVEENGEGEVVGGIVVMRFGENAKDVIERAKARMKDIEKGLLAGEKENWRKRNDHDDD